MRKFSSLLTSLVSLIAALLLNSFFVGEIQANIDNIRLQKLTVKDGLSQGTINSVMQDNTGLMWFGTDNGIDIYDGYSVRHLLGPDNDFHEFSAFQISQNSQGLIWFNIYDKGLYTFDPSTNQYQLILRNDPVNKEYVVSYYLEIDQDTLWIATTKTIGLFNRSSNTFEQIADFSEVLNENNSIYVIKIFNDIIYATSPKGTFALNTLTKKWRLLPSSSHTSINSSVLHNNEANKTYNIHISKDGQLYLGTNDGVFKLSVKDVASYIEGDGELPKYDLVIEGLSTWSFYEENNFLYIGSHLGLSALDTDNDEVDFLFGFSDVFDTMTNNVIQSLTKDNNGSFWLGSSSQGVYQWSPKQQKVKNFRYHKNKLNSLSDNNVQSIHQSITDPTLLWIGTANGLSLLNLETNNVETFLTSKNSKSMFVKSNINKVVEDNSQRLWIATGKELVVFDTITKKVIEPKFSAELTTIFQQEYYDMFLDDKQWLWYATNKGLTKISLETFEIDTLPEVREKVTADGIWAVLGLLPNTQKMILSTNDTLWGYDNLNRDMSILYQHPDILKTDYTTFDSWVVDENNMFWTALTLKGILGLTLPTFENAHFINKNNSIIDINIYGLMADKENDLWFSTHAGIFMLNTQTHHLRHFGLDDGFVSIEFNFGAHTKLKDNRLAYGGVDGLSIFDPKLLKLNEFTSETKVHITNINLLSRELNAPLIFHDNDLIKLEYDDVGIRIDFSTLKYSGSQQNQFKYSLKGDSNVEYPSTNKNNIIFPSLPSGEHLLEIKVKDPITGQYSKTTKIRFQVSYAPWASPLAYVVYSIIIITLTAIWLYRRKLKRQQLLDIHEEVKYRENRLQLALTGSNSEVWDWQAHNNLMFGKRASQDLGYSELTFSYHFNEHVELIHPDDRENFISSWLAFHENNDVNDSFSCTYRLKGKDGNWLWYKDLGKIVSIAHDGKPNRITGSYTNITESRASEERALYYGDAFKQTKDWVLIISENFTRVTANKSMRTIFNWASEEFQYSSSLLGLKRDRQLFYNKILLSLKEGEHWRGEELIQTPDNEEYHVIVNVNVSNNNTTNSLHYVCVFTDITAQKTAEHELRYLANYDYLTNLPNRSLLLERIKHAMDYSKRKKSSIALFFIDLDRFKNINDSLGHDYGDMLLKEITYRISNILRIDDTVARIGGDEFVVLLESFKGNTQLSNIAQKIIQTVGQPISLNDHVVSVGASIGIALYPDDAEDSDELLRNADVAMYHAKQLGRNTFQFFTQRMNSEATARLKTESNIQLGHKNNEFINHYQPVINAFTGKAIGAELLMRWQTKDGLVSPASFIPVAEELRLIIPMTEAALNRGLSDLKEWRKIRPEMFLSVNLSPQHFAKESLVPYVRKLLIENDIPASALKLEVTESALISEPQKAIMTMRALSDLGVALALDDFGTGYSSLSYLKNLPLDVIKIDRVFVSGIGEDSADEAIVDATLVLAKNLKMYCIAEGVETIEQLNYLAERGCNYIQGFLYSKPISASQFTQFLIEDRVEILAFRNKGNS